MTTEFRLTRYQTLNRNTFFIFVDGIAVSTTHNVDGLMRSGTLPEERQFYSVIRRGVELSYIYCNPRDITEQWK